MEVRGQVLVKLGVLEIKTLKNHCANLLYWEPQYVL